MPIKKITISKITKHFVADFIDIYLCIGIVYMPKIKNTPFFYRTRTSKFAKKKRRKTKTTRRKRRKSLAVVYGHVYSDSCGFCVAMKEDWQKLISSVSDVKLIDVGENYDEHIARINAEYKSDLAYEGLPTIYKISKIGAKAEYFSGERTTTLMRKWLYAK